MWHQIRCDVTVVWYPIDWIFQDMASYPETSIWRNWTQSYASSFPALLCLPLLFTPSPHHCLGLHLPPFPLLFQFINVHWHHLLNFLKVYKSSDFKMHCDKYPESTDLCRVSKVWICFANLYCLKTFIQRVRIWRNALESFIDQIQSRTLLDAGQWRTISPHGIQHLWYLHASSFNVGTRRLDAGVSPQSFDWGGGFRWVKTTYPQILCRLWPSLFWKYWKM